MLLEELNPYLRYAQTQPLVLEGNAPIQAYDCRLFYGLSGNGFLHLKDRRVPFGAKSLAYVPYHSSYYFEGDIQGVVFNFDITRLHSHNKQAVSPDYSTEYCAENAFETPMPDRLEMPLVLENGGFAEGPINEILFEHRFPGAVSDGKTSALLKLLLCETVKLSFFPEDQHVTTELVINYIKNNYTEKISNAQIAEKFGYNPLYLNRIFKGDTGMTLHKYILKERVTLAKQLLKNTTLSVEEIGADCGFANQTHFCTAFKTVTGKSPTAYRNG